MSEKRLDLEIPSVDDLFKVSDDDKNKVVKIPIYQIEDFPDHPFKVKRDEELNKLAESIKEHGVFNPVIVREIGDRHYEMISGHRRKEASKLAGKQEINAIIENVDDDTATIMMVDSNMQREKVLPSERAFAYKMKLEALKHQGKKLEEETSTPVAGKNENLTSTPVVEKLKHRTSIEQIAEQNNESDEQVRRYIRLTYLIPEILDMVDEEKIAFRPAVEISYLTDEEQYQLLDAMELNEATPSLAQAIDLKRRSQEGKLTSDNIDTIIAKEKPNQIPKMKINEERFLSIIPRKYDTLQKQEDFLYMCVQEHLQREKKKQQNLSR